MYRVKVEPLDLLGWACGCSCFWGAGVCVGVRVCARAFGDGAGHVTRCLAPVTLV